MQRIDFIPNEYRIRREKRQSSRWRRLILAVGLGLMLLGWAHQWRTGVKLEKRRDQLQLQARNLESDLLDANELQSQIERLDEQSTLLALLQLTPSTSRVLEAVAACRPRFVSLTEINLQRERKAARPTPGEGASTTGKPTQRKSQKKPADPVANDLRRLREKQRETSLVLLVSGLAPSHLAVSQYMAALQESGLFSDQRLIANGQQILRGEQLQSFKIRLQIRGPFDSPNHESQAGPESGAPQVPERIAGSAPGGLAQ